MTTSPKTNRTRNTASHQALFDDVALTLSDMQAMIDPRINMVLERSTERRFARTLFNLHVSGLVLQNKTVEEINMILQGMSIAHAWWTAVQAGNDSVFATVDEAAETVDEAAENVDEAAENVDEAAENVDEAAETVEDHSDSVAAAA